MVSSFFVAHSIRHFSRQYRGGRAVLTVHVAESWIRHHNPRPPIHPYKQDSGFTGVGSYGRPHPGQRTVRLGPADTVEAPPVPVEPPPALPSLRRHCEKTGPCDRPVWRPADSPTRSSGHCTKHHPGQTTTNHRLTNLSPGTHQKSCNEVQGPGGRCDGREKKTQVVNVIETPLRVWKVVANHSSRNKVGSHTKGTDSRHEKRTMGRRPGRERKRKDGHAEVHEHKP